MCVNKTNQFSIFCCWSWLSTKVTQQTILYFILIMFHTNLYKNKLINMHVFVCLCSWKKANNSIYLHFSVTHHKRESHLPICFSVLVEFKKHGARYRQVKSTTHHHNYIIIKSTYCIQHLHPRKKYKEGNSLHLFFSSVHNSSILYTTPLSSSLFPSSSKLFYILYAEQSLPIQLTSTFSWKLHKYTERQSVSSLSTMSIWCPILVVSSSWTAFTQVYWKNSYKRLT